MTEKELWQRFTAENALSGEEYEAWSFGADPDLLAQLVAAGEKTATSSAYPLYELEKEPLPAVGAYSIILDAKDNAVCIIQTTQVTIVPFHEVTAAHARKEGEGDKSLAHWKDVHEKFFGQCMADAGLLFTQDMLVVCEEFTVVCNPTTESSFSGFRVKPEHLTGKK